MKRIPLRAVAVQAAVVSLAALLGGCATQLPSHAGRQASTHVADTADTQLGRAIAGMPAKPGTSGVFPLSVPVDAFAARVLLMRAAERSLDIQYYIWQADTTGTFLLDEVRRAAERGVRVRLLLDDNGIAGLDPDLAMLDAHPNIEVRLFNPFVQRRFKALGYLTDFERLNRRMHNKSLTADAQATIVGGRNIGDIYFGANPEHEYNDLDVLAVGPVARDVSRAFDEYWNSASAYPAAVIIPAPDPQAADALDERLAALRESPDAAAYIAAVRRSDFVHRLLARSLPIEWVPVRVIYDPPVKAEGGLPSADLLMAQMGRTMGEAQREFDVVSPYFVPGELGTEALARYPAKGVRLRIVTNSLAATDVAAVHAGYAKRREDLLRAGVRLYEFKPNAERAPENDAGAQSGFRGSSGASLHGKTFSVDRTRLFVGSFNVDPRSALLNSEMGLVIESEALATALSEQLDQRLAKLAYEVRLSQDGSLEWIEQTDAGEVRYAIEPKATLGRRIGTRIMSWLPIEWLL